MGSKRCGAGRHGERTVHAVGPSSLQTFAQPMIERRTLDAAHSSVPVSAPIGGN
jgi:hypothetical protein